MDVVYSAEWRHVLLFGLQGPDSVLPDDGVLRRNM